MSYAPGTEPHGRSYEEESLRRCIHAALSIPIVKRIMLETDRVNAEPGTPKPPKEAPHFEINPASIVESAENFISPKPNVDESISEFGEKFQEACKKANPPGHSTLEAMENGGA